MNLGLRNKTVLITAANGGLGPSLGLNFYKEGANLILISRCKNRLVELRSNILNQVPNHKSGVIQLLPLDLSDQNSPRDIFKFLQNESLSPDVIVHHLGGTLGIKSNTCSIGDWNRVLWHNALFAAELNSLLIPNLLKKKWSRVVHISSISSKSLRGSGPYASAKAFLDAYAITLAREYSKTNLVVSIIRPGALFVKNGPWDHNINHNPKMVDDFLRHHHACGRLGQADEITPFVLLLSSELATFAQGAIFNIDGGTM